MKTNTGRPKGRKKYKQIQVSEYIFEALNEQKGNLSWDKYISLLLVTRYFHSKTSSELLAK
jgi:hypothetical protein